MKKKILLTVTALIFTSIFTLAGDEWRFSKSGNYMRITDCIIEDLDNDHIDEIIISYFSYPNKFIDVYKVINGQLTVIDVIKVPYSTVFFDVGDIDNNKKSDIVFLSSDGLYFREITHKLGKNTQPLTLIQSVKSEIVVPQPELLTDVNMVIDLDGDSINELIIENIRAIEIYETKTFSKLSQISLQTILEYALIPGQFYPHLIFYTLPIILVKDLDNDKKMEIVTKFPTSINIYSQNNLSQWRLKNRINVGRDNIYFLSNAYLKFAFPLIEDIDNDKNKEIIVSSANLNMPRLKFEAIGDIYYFNKGTFTFNDNKKIQVKGIPLNLPHFYNISDDKYKDFILPTIPFNLISIFGLLSGAGSLKVPFLYFKQNNEHFDLKHAEKLFDIHVRIENITSFVEELPLDHFKNGEFPDFYYFMHDFKEKTVDIMYYYYDTKKEKYRDDIALTLDIPNFRADLPATLKLGHLTNTYKKDVVYITHQNLFIITRK